jgi:hypothetical protein
VAPCIFIWTSILQQLHLQCLDMQREFRVRTRPVIDIVDCTSGTRVSLVAMVRRILALSGKFLSLVPNLATPP